MDIKSFCKELELELHESILDYWIKNTLDEVNGGFVGQITYDNIINPEADKGCILNSRILWSFSAACHMFKRKEYLAMADRAYDYFINHFIDNQYGGTYWMLNSKGEPVDDSKQVYGQVFSIYGLSTYYQATNNEEALRKAIDLYYLVEKHSYDSQKDGYMDAFSRTWEATDYSMINPSGPISPKTMNTHLHVLEAYTQLYRVWQDEGLKKQLKGLIRIHLDKIINKDTNHFDLFFERDWNPTSDIISFGHDIEGAWLMNEAAEVLGQESLIKEVQQAALKMADAVLKEGIAPDGSLLHEGQDNKIIDSDRHWWPQAEAMVGFVDAYQKTGNEKYLNAAQKVWGFIKKHLMNPTGEWYWSVDENYTKNTVDDKAGPWKAPYHNSRACMEIIHRLK
ncbi:MAG: AGE family epimerase/isomerase [Bacteroidota bacterium]